MILGKWRYIGGKIDLLEYKSDAHFDGGEATPGWSLNWIEPLGPTKTPTLTHTHPHSPTLF